jgi:hypothetical protein
MEKIYHIYAKDKCIFHSLKEDQFKDTWNSLNNLINLLDTHYVGEDLSYEELFINKEVLLNSSH